MMNDPLDELLTVLADLDEAVLLGIYGIDRENEAPLDVALFAWRDAGCPRVVGAAPAHELITDGEYAALAEDHGAVARLEGYDADVTRLKAAARDVIDAWTEASPRSMPGRTDITIAALQSAMKASTKHREPCSVCGAIDCLERPTIPRVGDRVTAENVSALPEHTMVVWGDSYPTTAVKVALNRWGACDGASDFGTDAEIVTTEDGNPPAFIAFLPEAPRG